MIAATDTSASTEHPTATRYKPPRKPRLGVIAGVVSRYVQLTWQGRELRGECPGCRSQSLYVIPAYDDRDKCYYALPHGECWRCFSCGAHELGGRDGTAEGFILFAAECGLQPHPQPLAPLPEPRLTALRWTRTLPPYGSYPNLAPLWLGAATAVEEQRDEQGRRYGYHASYPDTRGQAWRAIASPGRPPLVLYWIYVRYSPNDPGQWKARRPPLRERVAALFPEIPSLVAKSIEGRSRVTVSELLRCYGAKENPSSYRAKAIAWSLRAQGWVRKREGSGGRHWYYTSQ